MLLRKDLFVPMVFNIPSDVVVLLGKDIINSNDLNYGKGKRFRELGFTYKL